MLGSHDAADQRMGRSGCAPIIALLLTSARPASAQEHGAHQEKETAESELEHEHVQEDMVGLLGIPRSREASGTAWQPDAVPMRAIHARLGRLSLMAHGNIFFGYNRQFEDRGDDHFTSTNWLMLMAR